MRRAPHAQAQRAFECGEHRRFFILMPDQRAVTGKFPAHKTNEPDVNESGETSPHSKASGRADPARSAHFQNQTHRSLRRESNPEKIARLTAVSLPFRNYGSSFFDQGRPSRISPTGMGYISPCDHHPQDKTQPSRSHLLLYVYSVDRIRPC